MKDKYLNDSLIAGNGQPEGAARAAFVFINQNNRTHPITASYPMFWPML